MAISSVPLLTYRAVGWSRLSPTLTFVYVSPNKNLHSALRRSGFRNSKMENETQEEEWRKGFV